MKQVVIILVVGLLLLFYFYQCITYRYFIKFDFWIFKSSDNKFIRAIILITIKKRFYDTGRELESEEDSDTEEEFDEDEFDYIFHFNFMNVFDIQIFHEKNVYIKVHIKNIFMIFRLFLKEIIKKGVTNLIEVLKGFLKNEPVLNTIAFYLPLILIFSALVLINKILS